METMLQDQEPGSLRRSLSRRRSFRSGAGMDDRGWTLLHIGSRKGDLKQVISMSSFCECCSIREYCYFFAYREII